MTFDSIPAFSMLDIQQRDAETISQLKLALTSHGFFTITDHGIADEVLKSSYTFSKDFLYFDIFFCCMVYIFYNFS